MDNNKIKVWNVEQLKEIELENLDLDYFSYKDGECLTVFLCSKTHKIKLMFFGFESFRATDESCLLAYWGNLKNIKNQEKKNKNFFLIENSTYLKEISNLSNNFVVYGRNIKVKHYAIFLNYALCIEVLSDSPPTIEVKVI